MSFLSGLVNAFRKAAPAVNKISRNVSRVAGGASTIMKAAGVSRSVTRVTQRISNVAGATQNTTRTTAGVRSAGRKVMIGASGSGSVQRP